MNISTFTFWRWIKNLGDANMDVCLSWFSQGRTFDEVFAYLGKSWDREEIAAAFMR